MHVSSRKGFTLIELLVVIAIIAILAVVVILTLNPAELLRQSRDANRVSDIATLTNALNLYVTDQAGASSFSLGNASNTYPSTYDLSATSTNACPSLGFPALNASLGQAWQCSASSSYRNVNSTGWIPVNLTAISAGTPIGSLPVDPTNQTSSGLFYAYNTNGNQFEVTANLESQKYKGQYGQTVQTSYFPEVISGGTPTVSALYNPSGLVGWWPLTEGSGSSTIDQSGSGDTGAWVGASSGTNSTHYTAGKIGSSAGYFDGSTNYVGITSQPSLQPSGALTVSAWIKASYATTSYFGIVTKDGSCTGGYCGYDLGSYGNHRSVFDIRSAANGNTSDIFGPATAIDDGSWHFVVGEFTGSQVSTYTDGVAGSPSSWNYPSAPSAQQFQIGARTGIGPSYFGGLIDDVRIYNRALSPAEIQSLYTAEH